MTNEDFRWWWNMHELELQMLLQVDLFIVVFTPHADDAYGGDMNGDGPSSGWLGDWVWVQLGGSGSRLGHWLFRFGGSSGTYPYPVYVQGDDIEITDCIVEYCEGGGTCASGSSFTVSGTIVRDVPGSGIVCAGGSPTIDGNTAEGPLGSR